MNFTDSIGKSSIQYSIGRIGSVGYTQIEPSGNSIDIIFIGFVSTQVLIQRKPPKERTDGAGTIKLIMVGPQVGLDAVARQAQHLSLEGKIELIKTIGSTLPSSSWKSLDRFWTKLNVRRKRTAPAKATGAVVNVNSVNVEIPVGVLRPLDDPFQRSA